MGRILELTLGDFSICGDPGAEYCSECVATLQGGMLTLL